MSHFISLPVPANKVVALDYNDRVDREHQTGLYSVTWEGYGLTPELHQWFVARRRRYQIQYWTNQWVIRMNKRVAVMFKLTWGGKI